ncbi:hypothetical protein DB032_07755 [Chromobacterium sp. Panama]|uniref:hypothetical protein n=1 Tax=Chromobacterium sp. Panama TaxID=2161826 RepID=UPI000D2F4E7B|nr:hypothetical protein [Chromobacterium sp. Panama]PTU64820.1 hypothetical protein DB032_07755 [Chromobacterium sp. Panama]
MATYSFLDEMKSDFLEIINEKSSSAIDDLSIDYGASLENLLLKYMALCQSRAALLSGAKSVNDELAMQSALLRLRSYAMGLSSLFDAIADDAETILKTGEWPELPEGYELPDCYGNFGND